MGWVFMFPIWKKVCFLRFAGSILEGFGRGHARLFYVTGPLPPWGVGI